MTGPAAKKKRKHAEREKSELNPQEIKDHLRTVSVYMSVLTFILSKKARLPRKDHMNFNFKIQVGKLL